MFPFISHSSETFPKQAVFHSVRSKSVDNGSEFGWGGSSTSWVKGHGVGSYPSDNC
ncbi:MAG TPA: hypothetical protein VK084_07550 [Chitinophagaceae bacterium]|nr:hypothetical protein [Chitinophagaceae bacterium]